MSRKGRVPKEESKLKDLPFEETSFMDKFEKLEDPRSERNKLYTIAEILLVTFCSIVCGADGWKRCRKLWEIQDNLLERVLAV